MEGEYAEFDDYAGPEASAALQAQLRELGKDATLHVHPGTHHAFFNDARPEVYDAAASATAWDRTTALFRAASGVVT